MLFCFHRFYFARTDPPTREELINNLAIMQMKKTNADKIDAKFAKPITPEDAEEGKKFTGMSFPSYKEYERVPGKKPTE